MRKLWLFFPVLLLSACIGTSRPARFYNLQAENIGAYSNAAVRADIGVREVKIPDYLDKPQIATLKSGGVEVDISELNRWSESLSTMIQRVVADDLGYNLPKAVVKPRVSAREDFKYLLQIEIGQLDGSWNKTANLEAWWSIADASGNLLVQQKSSLSVPLGNGYDDLVRAESRLLAELSAQIAPALSLIHISEPTRPY